MREHCFKLLVVTALVGGIFGCKASRPNLQPPTPAEMYKLPANEPRYSEPPTYPKDMLDQIGPKKKDTKTDPNAPPGAGVGGGRSGAMGLN